MLVKAFVVLRPGADRDGTAVARDPGLREAADRAVQVPSRRRVRGRPAPHGDRQAATVPAPRDPMTEAAPRQLFHHALRALRPRGARLALGCLAGAADGGPRRRRRLRAFVGVAAEEARRAAVDEARRPRRLRTLPRRRRGAPRGRRPDLSRAARHGRGRLAGPGVLRARVRAREAARPPVAAHPPRLRSAAPGVWVAPGTLYDEWCAPWTGSASRPTPSPSGATTSAPGTWPPGWRSGGTSTRWPRCTPTSCATSAACGRRPPRLRPRRSGLCADAPRPGDGCPTSTRAAPGAPAGQLGRARRERSVHRSRRAAPRAGRPARPVGAARVGHADGGTRRGAAGATGAGSGSAPNDHRPAHPHEVVQGADVVEGAGLGERHPERRVRRHDPGVQLPTRVAPRVARWLNRPGGAVQRRR